MDNFFNCCNTPNNHKFVTNDGRTVASPSSETGRHTLNENLKNRKVFLKPCDQVGEIGRWWGARAHLCECSAVCNNRQVRPIELHGDSCPGEYRVRHKLQRILFILSIREISLVAGALEDVFKCSTE